MTKKSPITSEQIQEYSDRIAAEFKPERIILFGSYAYGAPTADSDVDLLVRTPAQVEQRLAWNDWFMREIVEKGKVVYAAAHHGVDR